MYTSEPYEIWDCFEPSDTTKVFELDDMLTREIQSEVRVGEVRASRGSNAWVGGDGAE